MGRRAVLAGALAAALALLPVQAGAHAFVSRTEPRQSANLAESPSQVRIWFDGPVEKMYLEVRVETEDKRRVDKKDARLNPRTTPWSSGAARLAAGRYRVLESDRVGRARGRGLLLPGQVRGPRHFGTCR